MDATKEEAIAGAGEELAAEICPMLSSLLARVGRDLIPLKDSVVIIRKSLTIEIQRAADGRPGRYALRAEKSGLSLFGGYKRVPHAAWRGCFTGMETDARGLRGCIEEALGARRPLIVGARANGHLLFSNHQGAPLAQPE